MWLLGMHNVSIGRRAVDFRKRREMCREERYVVDVTDGPAKEISEELCVLAGAASTGVRGVVFLCDNLDGSRELERTRRYQLDVILYAGGSSSDQSRLLEKNER